MSDITISLKIENLLGADAAPLYCKYQRQINAQPAYIEMDEDGEVSADYSGEIGNSMPMLVWHRRTLRWTVPNTVRGSSLAAFLRSAEVQQALQAVHDGHSVDWDGNNHVGRLDDTAKQASDQLEKMIEEGFSSDDGCVAVWSVAEWLFNGCELSDHWESQSLDDAVSALKAAAESDGVYLDGDIRKALLDQAESHFDEDGDDGLTPIHIAELLADGRITQEQAESRGR